MQNTRKVTDDIVWVGCNDRRLTLFENLFPIPRGVSYNSYLVMDEKVTLLDTVDVCALQQFMENIDSVSYTHLDVYKRQMYILWRLCGCLPGGFPV